MDLEKIFNTLTTQSQYEVDGYILISKIKKKHNCTTDDILRAQSPHKIKKINIGRRVVFSHTRIYDYGITHDDIRRHQINDNKKRALTISH